MSIPLRNTIRMGTGVVLASLFNIKRPINVVISVTDRCQARCRYCNIPQRAKREMTTSEMLNLIDQISDLGVCRIALWGGEPLLRNDIGIIINYIKKKGIFVTLDTNGWLVSEKIKEIQNLDILVVSIDGPEDVHDKVRGKGSFKKAFNGIQVAVKKLPVWTITVLSKENLNCVDDILNLAQKTGFLTTFQVLHHNTELAGDSSSLLPSNEEYRKVIQELIKRKKEGAPIISSLSYLNYVRKWKDFDRSFSLIQNFKLKCWAGKLYCNVDTDGAVWPCSVMCGQMESLNALEVGFKKAFYDMPLIKCRECNSSCFVECNHLCSLSPDVIWNILNGIKVKIH